MKKVATVLFLVFGGWAFGQNSYGEIIGSVIYNNDKDNDVIIGAKVWVEENDKKYQCFTDVEGKFRISAVPAGHYLLSVSFGEELQDSLDVDVVADGFGKVGTTGIIRFGAKELIGATVSALEKTMKLELTAIPTFKLSSRDIVKSSLKFSVAGMVSMMTSDAKMSEDGELMFRGSRGGDMLYLVDGIKTREIGPMPSAAINSMQVYTGGLPAKYGDTMGGVIVLETKSYFDMLKERNAQ